MLNFFYVLAKCSHFYKNFNTFSVSLGDVTNIPRGFLIPEIPQGNFLRFHKYYENHTLGEKTYDETGA